MSFKHQMKRLVIYSREGSIQTQRDRINIFSQLADFLISAGFKLSHPKGLKQKHVDVLVKGWIDGELNARTIDNRLSHLRWLCTKMGKPNLMHRDNAFYRGAAVKRATPELRGKEPDWQKWHELPEGTPEERCAKATIALCWLAGIRLKAAIMCKPKSTPEGVLEIRRGEDKNGRPNFIEYRYQLEKDIGLRSIDSFIKEVSIEMGGRLIPSNKTYAQQRDYVEYVIRSHRLGSSHDRRHTVARDFYDERVKAIAKTIGIDPWCCPVRNGPQHSLLTEEQAKIDFDVRTDLATYLGHNRLEVVKSYIG